MLRKIYYMISPGMRLLARRIWFYPNDLLAHIFHRQQELTPPKGLIYTGSGDFRKEGEEFASLFVKFGGIHPDSHILDIGSGIGRIAIPLTNYLSESGSYDGFDVVEAGVAWCNKHIAAKFPNFQFKYIPLKNDLYRKSGIDAGQLRFPYESGRFDFCCLISVFTHMMPAEVENYFNEIYRVMKSSGKCFATFFLLNDESKFLLSKQKDFTFPYHYGTHALMNKKVQTANVAFEESYILDLTENKFNVVGRMPGYWCGRDKTHCSNFQDILVLQKN